MSVRIPKAKRGELKAVWGKTDRYENPSVCYLWGGGGAQSPDARVLSRALEDLPVLDGRTLVAELESRGYDLTTLKFTIQLKPEVTITSAEPLQPK